MPAITATTTKDLRAWISAALLAAAFIGFLGFTVWLNTHEKSEQHFAFLARSFLHGTLAFREMPGPSSPIPHCSMASTTGPWDRFRPFC